ncbi:MAG: endonuclease domain-containing protein [Candidatus Binataceae bacterium]
MIFARMNRPPELTRNRARTLRRTQTDAEQALWNKLRGRRCVGFKFRWQVPIGPYIADFCCRERRLIVELDGGQHLERMEQDSVRTRYLEAQGFRVIRFWNPDLLRDMAAALERIKASLL